MSDNTILGVEEAARLVHSSPETLLQYIQRGELLAARIGKNFVITHVSLTTFVNTLAARQSMERHARQPQPEYEGVSAKGGRDVRTKPAFVQVAGMGAAGPANNKHRGARKQIPALPLPSAQAEATPRS